MHTEILVNWLIIGRFKKKSNFVIKKYWVHIFGMPKVWCMLIFTLEMSKYMCLEPLKFISSLIALCNKKTKSPSPNTKRVPRTSVSGDEATNLFSA